MIHRLPFDKRLEVDEFLNGINDVLNHHLNIHIEERGEMVACLYNNEVIFDFKFQHIFIEVSDSDFNLFQHWILGEILIAVVNYWNFHTYNMSEFYRNKKTYSTFFSYLSDNYKWGVKKITTFVWTTYYLNSWLDEKILGIKLEPINFISKWKYFIKMLFYKFK